MRRNVTGSWFETKISYNKTMPDGLEKRVREAYAVEAMTFTEAEAAITSEMQPYISGEFSVVEEKIAPYREVYLDDGEDADKFYKAKVAIIVIDEKTGKEKRTPQNYLVQASSLEDARKRVDDIFAGSMEDYEQLSVSESKVLAAFAHE